MFKHQSNCTDRHGIVPELMSQLTNDPTANCNNAINDLLETHPSAIGRQDMALLNLLCAPNLPGSEDLNIPRCIERIDRLAAFVKASTERSLHCFPDDPDYGRCEPMWRMAKLVTNVKLDFGVTYDPVVAADLAKDGDSVFTDSRNVFIHGMLGDDPARRWGSCSSIPVLITAVARRLRYPVGLAVNHKHVYARWDDGMGFAFNIEASNPAGMAVRPDEHYRTAHGVLTPKDEQSGFYVRTLLPAEEFAMFLQHRVCFLHDIGRYAETMLWSARALQFSPDDPRFPHHAYMTTELAIKHRYRQRHPTRPIPPPERNEEFFCKLSELLTVPERSLFFTITAHYAESQGNLDRARAYYENSCRQNFHGNNEQRDLQRFLRKHGLKLRTRPLLPPKNLGQPRRIILSCKPEYEADDLRRLARQFERSGEFLKARDTLHDLYMFDPCDAEVFHHARAIEKHPQFQTQLKTLTSERRKVLAKSGRLNHNPVQRRSI